MKKSIFSATLLTIFLISICFMYGCSDVVDIKTNTLPSNTEQSQSTLIITEEAAQTPTSTLQPVATATPVPRATAGASDGTVYKSEELEITYKNPDTQETVVEKVQVKSDKDPSAVLEAVKETFLTDIFGNIEVNKVVQTDVNIFIDFTESIYVLAQNPSEEYPALEAIADAYLNNVEGAKGVYITVNGGGYSSMNMEYDADEPFKTK